MTDDDIPIDGEDDEPATDFHEPGPEHGENIFEWFSRKFDDGAGSVAEVVDDVKEVTQGVTEFLTSSLADIQTFVSANPEAEIMSLFNMGSLIQSMIEDRIRERLPETNEAFRNRFMELVKESQSKT